MRNIKSLILSLSLFGCLYAGLFGGCDSSSVAVGDSNVIKGGVPIIFVPSKNMAL